ncbi:MAG TPA: biotin/lipoyl-binding protein [Candidatus Didemnitutus sp.]|nr:biotin/lipoyl-binding protein [Candidatus Didemnitutus sp.]
MKVILPLLAAAGVAVAVVEVLHSQQVVPPVAPAAAMPETPFPQTVAGVGLVEAGTENISVGSETAGVVTRIFVKVGDQVQAGEPLFELDGRALRAELAFKQAAVKAAEVALENAKFDYAISAQLTSKQVNTINDREEKRFTAEKAQAALVQAQADVKTTETNIALLTVKAPVTGQILQLKVHLGEFAPDASTATAQPAVLLGSTAPLNVRAEFDENDAWRVRKEAAAVGFARGNARTRIPLTFVRFEPYVVPKVSLTGASTERVDTRVLQVIYSLDRKNLPIFAGQQMDVFIDAPSSSAAQNGANEPEPGVVPR